MVFQRGQTFTYKRNVSGDTADNLYLEVKQPQSTSNSGTPIFVLSHKMSDTIHIPRGTTLHGRYRILVISIM